MELQPIKKILVPIDFSETGLLALEHAGLLARLSKADLVMIHIRPLNEYYLEITAPELRIEKLEQLYEIIGQKLTEVSDYARTEFGVEVKTMTTSGRVAEEVVKTAREENVDLIVMGTHGAKGFAELFLGSNAHKIVSLSPCPVITVQTHAKKIGFTNIVLPIDRTPHSLEKVELAISIANLYASKIHILGLLEEESQDDYNKLQLQLDRVQHLIEKQKLVFSRQTLTVKNIAQESLRYAGSIEADLIVIMTDQESELTGVFMGPLAKQIVNHSRIPVLSVRPHTGKPESVSLGGSYRFY
jgi:nucleotide-binding universal stress UspA family protein